MSETLTVEDLALTILTNPDWRVKLASCIARHINQNMSLFSYSTFRQEVYECLKKINSSWSYLNKHETSIIAFIVFSNLHPDVTNDPETYDWFIEQAPEYTQDTVRKYVLLNQSSFTPINPTPMENNMAIAAPSPSLNNQPSFEVPVIEHRTYIRGQDSRALTDDQIFNIIGNLEYTMKELRGIKHKPQKLKAKIESIKAEIAELVAFVDAR